MTVIVACGALVCLRVNHFQASDSSWTTAVSRAEAYWKSGVEEELGTQDIKTEWSDPGEGSCRPSTEASVNERSLDTRFTSSIISNQCTLSSSIMHHLLRGGQQAYIKRHETRSIAGPRLPLQTSVLDTQAARLPCNH